METNGLNEKDRSSIKELLESVKKYQEVGIESLIELRDIFSLSKPTLESNNRQRISKGLEFQDMDVRFEEVSEAAKDTFEWFVRDFAIPKYCLELNLLF
jgi:hypothetical protein